MTDLHGADSRLIVENVAPRQTVRPHGKKVLHGYLLSNSMGNEKSKIRTVISIDKYIDKCSIIVMLVDIAGSLYHALSTMEDRPA
jgi:hypothetical protein